MVIRTIGPAKYFGDYNDAIEELRQMCKEFATWEP